MTANKIIMLVEDNAQDEFLTIRAFKKHHVQNEIFVARDGEQALDYLFCRGEYRDRDISNQPQVILLDLNLPKVNGLEVLKEIRSNPVTQSLPVVILTMSNDDSDRIQGYNLGINAYVKKPIDLKEFSEAIKDLELSWLILNNADSDKN